MVFIIFGLDRYKRKKMNILHIIVFMLGGLAIALFAVNPVLLDRFWKVFGSARGADVLVYIALILLFYFYIELVNKHTKDKIQLTKLISGLAIREWYEKYVNKMKNYNNADSKDEFVFAVRAYNEQSHVGLVIDDIIKAWYHKIMVVNDGSGDDTADMVMEKQQQYPDKLIILINHTINRGWWAANQTLFNFIKKYHKQLQVTWMVTYDADGQMDIHDMEVFEKYIHHHPAQVYLWSRFLKDSIAENMPTMRKIILWISRMVTFIFYGARVTDPHNGYRVIATSALDKIQLSADGMHYANELQEQIKINRLFVQEVPVHIRYTDYSLHKAHSQKNSNSLRLAVEMIYKKIFFR